MTDQPATEQYVPERGYHLGPTLAVGEAPWPTSTRPVGAPRSTAPGPGRTPLGTFLVYFHEGRHSGFPLWPVIVFSARYTLRRWLLRRGSAA